MTKQEIIETITTDKRFKNICKDIGGNNADDLYQDFVLTILEMNESTLSKIINIDFYSVRCLINLSRSKKFKSKYHSTHHELNEHKDEYDPNEKNEKEKQIKIIADELQKMEQEYNGKYPYSVNLFRAYVSEDCNFRKLQRITKINYVTSFKEIKKVKQRLKNKLNDI